MYSFVEMVVILLVSAVSHSIYFSNKSTAVNGSWNKFFPKKQIDQTYGLTLGK